MSEYSTKTWDSIIYALSNGPLDTEDLFNKVREVNPEASEVQIRAAIDDMVDSGQVNSSTDHRQTVDIYSLADDPDETRKPRRSYSGPSRATRLMHYRAAALQAVIGDPLAYEAFKARQHGMEWGQFAAQQAEGYAQAMLEAEQKSTKGGGK